MERRILLGHDLHICLGCNGGASGRINTLPDEKAIEVVSELADDVASRLGWMWERYCPFVIWQTRW